MKLMTYNPFDLQIDRLFDEAFRTTGWVPRYNAWEDKDRFCIEMVLPGWESKDVKLSVEDGVLTVEGAREEKKEAEDRTYFVREMNWGNFTRSFTLPTHVDAEKAGASFKDGILTIEFPKKEEAKPRQITIEAR
ncbi:MAG TPA: Hsp20/alpha crystallin family protein [Nitrospirales bacterium]|jgi:HSP20 family protein|nr:Hsp20/alpha crystallin family protein [Nitrospirales bacterium]